RRVATNDGKVSGLPDKVPPLVGRYRQFPKGCHQRWGGIGASGWLAYYMQIASIKRLPENIFLILYNLKFIIYSIYNSLLLTIKIIMEFGKYRTAVIISFIILLVIFFFTIKLLPQKDITIVN